MTCCDITPYPYSECDVAETECYVKCDTDAITEVTTDFDVDIEDAGLRGHHLPVVADV